MLIPLHQQIYERWRSDILSGRFRPGDRVPSTREAAETLGISRSTVSAAYEHLLSEGYFESSHGSGTFVCRRLPDELLRPEHSPEQSAAEPAIRLSLYGSRLRDDFRFPGREPGSIQFAQWRPALDHFPFGIWRGLIARHLRDSGDAAFDYAAQSAGYMPLRQQIARYLARFRGVSCTPEEIVIVNGSQQALDLCTRLLLEAGDEVALEEPGYQGARRIFTAHGAHLKSARIDAEGIAISDLSRKARAVYITPSHQFPTGVSMSLARRLDLLEWARKHGAVVIEDDYDSEYRYGSPPLPALQGLGVGAAVIYIGTFSKVMFPGLRIGYLVAPRQLVKPLTRAKWLADRQTPVLEQAALTDFLREGHLERHIRRMRRLYGRRREVLVEALARNFGDGASIRGDAAGMHLMVSFKDSSVGDRALANKVQIASASGYYIGQAPGGEFVLGFSSLGERTIREGIKRLAR